MTPYKNGQWLIGCKTSTYPWITVDAKTLLGAKRCATNFYQPSVDSKLQVAQVIGQQIVEMANKRGYDKWVNTP